MKKNLFSLSVLFIVVGVLFSLPFADKEASAGVDVSIGINIPVGPPPPRVLFAAPPAMMIIPGSPVVVAPHPDVDVFFYSGFWWSFWGDRWYRSQAYNGPWRLMDHRHVPHYVLGIPRDYRSVYAHEHHIPYGQWKKQHGYHPAPPYRPRPEYRYEERRGNPHGHGHEHGHGNAHKHGRDDY
jgi:hypothetical protein